MAYLLLFVSLHWKIITTMANRKMNKMRRMWVLYGLFFGIMLFCLALFLCDVVKSEDSYHLDNLQRQMKKEQRYGLIISDLIRTDNAFKYDIPITTTPKGDEIRGRINTFDLVIESSNPQNVDFGRIKWVMALQIVSVVSLITILILVLVVLTSFFKAIKEGRIFNRKSVRWLSAIGILMIVLALSIDTSTYLERCVAAQLLAGTEWAPMSEYTLHITRLFLGIIVLFVAEILRLGYHIQEEQDLVI